MKACLFALLLAPLLHAAEPILWPYDPPAEYLAIDLSPGPEAERYTGELIRVAPEGGWTKEFKTDKLLLRRVRAGTFTMGSPASEYGHRPDEVQHEVAITNAFHIGVFEITQRQWELVMGEGKIEPESPKGDDRPVGKTSYADAIAFTATLSAKTGLPFTLPTEAQWEYACRAGTTTALNTGKDISAKTDAAMTEAGRYRHNSNQSGGGKMIENRKFPWGHAPVGSYKPNAWGLYDMHGNVAEWCLDWYSENLGADPATDPAGPDSGKRRVLRGGFYDLDAHMCRSATRMSRNPAKPYSPPGCGFAGFRVLLPGVLLTPLFQK